MSDETTLRECPFCGGESKICHVRDICRDPQDWYWGKCLSCHIIGKHCPTETEAIAAWNTRAERTCHSIDPVDSSEFFICSNCNYGAGIIEFIPNYCPNCGAKVIGGDAE